MLSFLSLQMRREHLAGKYWTFAMRTIALWVLLTCVNVRAIVLSGDTSTLSEGRYCDLTGGGIGICKTKENCVGGTTAQGEECSSPLVCCPLPGAKSRQKCEEYSRIEKTNSCPGEGFYKAEPKEFPHMAAIGFNNVRNNEWRCGGVLISERYILTTAQCVNSRIGPPRRVRLGDLEQADREVVEVQQVTIEKLIPHPNYRPPDVRNDIGLLKLVRDVRFSSHVRPACLYTASEMSVSSGVALGWGRTDAVGELSSDLLKVKLPFVSDEVCIEAYKTRLSPRKGAINVSSMMCAGDIGRDTCQGDSGGPLQISRSGPGCMFDIVGLTSFGVFCGTGIPGVYTRVSNFVPWIESVVWP